MLRNSGYFREFYWQFSELHGYVDLFRFQALDRASGEWYDLGDSSSAQRSDAEILLRASLLVD